MHQIRLVVPLTMGFARNPHNAKEKTTCLSSKYTIRSSQVHSIITKLKVPNYKLSGDQHSSLHYADKHATITGNHTQGLFTADHVFIRQDLVKPALSPPDEGPYRVLKRTNKAYQLEMSGRIDWISLDRLKPAYMESASFDKYTRFDRKCTVPQRMDL